MSSPAQINAPRNPPYKLAGLAFLLIGAVILALVYGQFRGSFTPKTRLTMLASRAGLVMDPGAKVTYNGVEIATAKWLAPSMLLNYNFFSEDAAFRPYIGVGVNYTTFYDRRVTNGGQQVVGGPTRLSLTSSVGPIASAGIKYQPHTRWSVNVSYSISQVDTIGAVPPASASGFSSRTPYTCSSAKPCALSSATTDPLRPAGRSTPRSGCCAAGPAGLRRYTWLMCPAWPRCRPVP